jgi:hypothetical protein
LANGVPRTRQRTSDHLADEVVVIDYENPRHSPAAVELYRGGRGNLTRWRALSQR